MFRECRWGRSLVPIGLQRKSRLPDSESCIQLLGFLQTIGRTIPFLPLFSMHKALKP
jgi:hypothetical protein